MSDPPDEYSSALFPVTLVFSHDDPNNCVISLNEKPLYEVKSRREIVKKIGRNDLTVITEVFLPNGELIASVAWHGVYSDLITWPKRGLEGAKLSKWLKKSLMPYSNAKFKDDAGTSYKWDTKGPRGQFRLVEEKTRVIAYYERAMPYVNLEPGYNYNPHPKPARLHLSGRANAMLEEVVLSFLIAEKDRRRSDQSTEKLADGQAYGGTMGVGFDVM